MVGFRARLCLAIAVGLITALTIEPISASARSAVTDTSNGSKKSAPARRVAPKQLARVHQHGGYVASSATSVGDPVQSGSYAAAGSGMRDVGSGQITISGIPSGSTVT